MGVAGEGGYESVKRGAVTQTRNAQTVTLTFESRAAVMCAEFYEVRGSTSKKSGMCCRS